MGMRENGGVPDFETEFFGLPEYVINFARAEDAGNGHIRVYHWVRKGRVLEPTFTALISAIDVLRISGDVRELAMDITIGRNVELVAS